MEILMKDGQGRFPGGNNEGYTGNGVRQKWLKRC